MAIPRTIISLFDFLLLIPLLLSPCCSISSQQEGIPLSITENRSIASVATRPNTLYFCEMVMNGSPVNPQDQFSVSSTINALISIQFPGREDGVVRFEWWDPNKRLRESFQETVKLPGGSGVVRSWLHFTQAEFSSPGDHLGSWRVRVYLDDMLIANSLFLIS